MDEHITQPPARPATVAGYGTDQQLVEDVRNVYGDAAATDVAAHLARRDALGQLGGAIDNIGDPLALDFEAADLAHDEHRQRARDRALSILDSEDVVDVALDGLPAREGRAVIEAALNELDQSDADADQRRAELLAKRVEIDAEHPE